MNSKFNICQNVHEAKSVCPRFCGLCALGKYYKIPKQMRSKYYNGNGFVGLCALVSIVPHVGYAKLTWIVK